MFSDIYSSTMGDSPIQVLIFHSLSQLTNRNTPSFNSSSASINPFLFHCPLSSFFDYQRNERIIQRNLKLIERSFMLKLSSLTHTPWNTIRNYAFIFFGRPFWIAFILLSRLYFNGRVDNNLQVIHCVYKISLVGGGQHELSLKNYPC